MQTNLPDSTPLLNSLDHAKVAHYLSGLLIEGVRAAPEQGGSLVADGLSRLRDIVWRDERSRLANLEEDTQGRIATYRDIIGTLKTVEQRRQFMEAYAKMGHLYELAGLVARDNVFAQLIDTKGKIPGGVQEFVETTKTAAEAVAKLNKPVFELVFTAHPTNVNSLKFIQSQHELGVEVDRVRRGDTTASARDAVDYYLGEKLLQETRQGEPENFSVHDETDFMLYYLGNVYKDLPRVYHRFDAQLKELKGYNPLDLKMQMRFASWGSSGDKDGNGQVNADTTLEAIAMHRHEIIKRYVEELQSIANPKLTMWLRYLNAAQQSLGTVISELGRDRIDGVAMPEWRFNQLSESVAEVNIPAKDFEEKLIEVYNEEHKPELLDLLRRVRTFGFNFARIEYRETAEEYARVVELMVPGYADIKDPAKRAEKLTEILQQPGAAQKLLAAARERIEKFGAGKPYSKEDAAAIAYHTIKRMELARDHPDMITDNVLAECKGADNLLEAQFLQAAVEKDGKRPVLGIVPLFEDPNTLTHVGDIMKSAYENPAYKAHLALLQKTRGGEVTQQVQIAHSDNTRRSGLPAARALISRAHELLRDESGRHKVKIQFYEGGSQSDPYRGGVRAISAMVKEYGLHDFAKFTFQGGDLLNWLNYTPSLMRLFTRNLSHSAIGPTNGTAKVKNHSDDIASQALIATLPDYQQNIFTLEHIGRLLGALQDNPGAGAAGSRSPSRTGAIDKQTNIDPDQGIRTITFSETLQHGAVNPSWFGVLTLYDNLKKAMAQAPAMSAVDKTDEGNRDLASLNADHREDVIRHFYQRSDKFKDVLDRVAFAVAQTDLDQLRRRHPDMAEHPFFARMEREYREAASLAYSARTGQPLSAVPGLPADPTLAQLQQVVKEAYPHLHKLFDDKNHYRDFALEAKNLWQPEPGMPRDNWLDRVIHSAVDTVVHGRYPTVDDPDYGRTLRKMTGQESELVLPSAKKTTAR